MAVRPDRPRPWFPDSAGPSRAGRDEIEIGARARRRRLARLVIGLAGGGLTVLAAAFIWALVPAQGRVGPNSYPVRVLCARCGYAEARRVGPQEAFPLVCSRCAERAAHELWLCVACKGTFVPDPNARERACPRCGSTRVGTAAGPP
ncbi:MAG TPA: hypothetical protein PKC49_12810 [Phycisphaerae bacterium]|nr:hypothetical protein [Phycisphaerae bacterium]